MKRAIALLLLMVLFFPVLAHASDVMSFEEFIKNGNFGIDVTGQAKEPAGQYMGEFELTSDSVINIKYKNAMITDILSVLAMHMKKNIFFIEEPIITSFEMFNVNPMVALEALLSREGLSYIERDGIIFVGAPSRLQDTFFDRMSMYEVRLQYINSVDFNEYLETLGVSIDRIVIKSNKNTMYVRGLPQELALVRDIKNALDKPENIASDIVMERVDLNYISPSYLTDLISGLEMEVDVLQPEKGKNVVWIRGSTTDLQEVREFIKFVDDPANMEENLPMQRIDLLYINTDILIEMVEQANLELDIYTVSHNPQTIWVQGPESQVRQLKEIINQVDIIQNRYVTKEFEVFAYQLDNVVPRDVIERIEEWEFKDLKIIGYNFPEFGNDILVLTPPEQKTAVIEALNAIDGKRRVIKLPVLVAEGTHPEDVLEEWRDILTELLHDRGIRRHTFTIMRYDLLGGTGDIDEDTGIRITKKAMYAEATPDRIQLIMDMLTLLEADDVLDAVKPLKPGDDDNGGGSRDGDDDDIKNLGGSVMTSTTYLSVDSFEILSEIDDLKASKDKKFVKFYMVLRNRSDSTLYTDRNSILLVGSSGTRYNYHYDATIKYGNPFPVSAITRNNVRDGNMVFEIPEDEELSKVIYKRGSEEVTVNL